MYNTEIAVFWFRRDLRLHDNAGLFNALNAGLPVLPVFIFDKNILDKLEDRNDARVQFIHERLSAIHQELTNFGSSLLVLNGNPLEVWQHIKTSYKVKKVFFNRDYEPYAIKRDATISTFLQESGIEVYTSKDQVVFEGKEITKEDNSPYTVFTPFSKKWLFQLSNGAAVSHHQGEIRHSVNNQIRVPYFPSENRLSALHKFTAPEFPSLASLGFSGAGLIFPPANTRQGVIRNYDKTRDFPAMPDGTSKLGVHYRFGTISVREKLVQAFDLNMTYVNELIWREFFSMIMTWFPQVISHAFRPKYDQIEWLQDEPGFRAWCEGRTGYPLVDAGMRELNATGYQHNRVRMVTASFLTKHLLIDWRWGEAYFARKLLDFDLSSNNGNWQWAAGCGTDAAPYFRVFNPVSQQEKFDKDFVYIKKWVPEYGTDAYPKPIVEHVFARSRCLEAYKKALT